MYISDDRTSWSGGAVWTSFQSNQTTITLPATADSAIVVAAYSTRGGVFGDLAGFSPEGEFRSLNYDYLVISGAKAQFKGFGQVNGNAGYNFILTVMDGDIAGGDDRFRIKIWEKATGAIVFDNQMGASDAADPTTPVGDGSSIVIRK